MKTSICLIGLIVLSGCNPFKQFEWPTCANDDPACWVQHMKLYNPDSDYPYDTAYVDAANMPYNGSGTLPSGSAVNYPYYTGTDYADLSAITFTLPTDPGYMTSSISFYWEDPTGWTMPNCVCASCPKNARCIKGGCQCPRGKHDGIFKGTWKVSIGFNAVPADRSSDTQLDPIFLPVSSSSSTDDPIESLQKGDSSKVVVGPQIGTKIKIVRDGTGGGSGGSGGAGGGTYDGVYGCTSVATSPAGNSTGSGTLSCGGGQCNVGTSLSGSVSATGWFDGTASLCTTCTPLRIQGQMSTSSSFTLKGSAGSTSMTLTCSKG